MMLHHPSGGHHARNYILEVLIMANKAMDSIKTFGQKARTAGFVIAAAMIILGCAAFLWPGRTSLLIGWMFLVGIVINGCFDIVNYFKSENKDRQSWQLINGLFSFIIGIMAIAVTGMAGKVLFLSVSL